MASIMPTQTIYVPPLPDFDLVMSRLPGNCTIQLTNGVYQTGGNTKWRPKSGQTIIGAGMTNTIIQLTNATDCITDSRSNQSITLSDLTLDCNHLAVSGVYFHGSGNKIHNVRLINADNLSTGPYRESFGILIAPVLFPVGLSNEISDCVVSNYTMSGINNQTAIDIVGDGSRLLRNHVFGDTNNPVFGFTLSGKDCLMESNLTVGCDLGYHSDTPDGTTNLTVDGNQFIGCRIAYFVANSTNYNTRILSNRMEFSSIGIKFEAPCAVIGCSIIGNQPVPTSSSINFMFLNGVHGLIAYDNYSTTNLFYNCDFTNVPVNKR
jgi:hypothetical protein